MADRDELRNGIPRKWQKSYKQLAEQLLPDEEIARSLLGCMHEDTQRYGTAPLCYMDEIAEELMDLAAHPLLNTSFDWLQLDNRIEYGAHLLLGSPSGAEAAERACEKIREDVSDGTLSGDNVRNALYEEYQRNIFDNFEDRVLRLEQHYANASRCLVEEKLESLRPYIEEGITNQAAKLMRDPSALNTIRPARVKRARAVDAKTEFRLMLDE